MPEYRTRDLEGREIIVRGLEGETERRDVGFDALRALHQACLEFEEFDPTFRLRCRFHRLPGKRRWHDSPPWRWSLMLVDEHTFDLDKGTGVYFAQALTAGHEFPKATVEALVWLNGIRANHERAGS